MTEIKRTQYVDPKRRVHESIHILGLPFNQLDILTEYCNEMQHSVIRSYPYYDDDLCWECYITDMVDRDLMLLKLRFA